MNRIKAKISCVTALLALFTLAGCGANRGTLTVVNTTLEPSHVIFEGKSLIIAPEQHFTEKNLKLGEHELKIGTNPPMKINIEKNKTTLVDLGGNNCFVVADYTDQYGDKGGGSIKIVEKFINETVFTTKSNITANLGEQLPKTVSGRKKITRLHRVDCSWIDKDQAIIDAIANLP